jgi:Dolichyl-phosphate-mannose-protein mannosyltransferase
MAVLAVVLTAASQGYGFHRDELYFRMLEPAWGFVDQPPLTPLLAHLLTGLVDEPWALRIPATLSAVAAVLVLVLITREVGGDRRAQTLCAWATAGATFPLLFGHVLLSASVDLVAWPLVCLFAIRAVLRGNPRWWLPVGLVIGLATYNKLLIGMLIAGLAVGVLAAGPRRILRQRLLWVGALVAAVVAMPNLLYQALNDWPQLAMGAALGENNGEEVRILTVPFLLLLLGPALVPVWLAGLIVPWRRGSDLRELRFVTIAVPVVTIATVAGGAQFYYPLGILAVLLAIGCRPVAAWASTRTRRAVIVGGLAVNALVSVVIALPVIPLGVLGSTPVPAINEVVAESVGWPTYVAEVAEVVSAARASGGEPVVVTSNYGEAGAIARYGPEHGIRSVYSGHNHLWFVARPPDGATSAVFVGAIRPVVRDAFAACRVEAELDNGLGVDGEEQGAEVTLCSGLRVPWTALWPRIAHLD